MKNTSKGIKDKVLKRKGRDHLKRGKDTEGQKSYFHITFKELQ